MSELLFNLLIIVLIGYLIFDKVGDWHGDKRESPKKLPKLHHDKAIPDSPLEEIKLELELAEQIFKGTAQLNLSYNRSDGTFTADLTFVDPIDHNTYHYTSTSSSVNAALNTVVQEYIHLIESQESPYGIKFR